MNKLFQSFQPGGGQLDQPAFPGGTGLGLAISGN